ncbi:hypothetical protein K435DRAFT_697356 [Dendrothele bispora CBS 962.96]|uniref:HNH nuclease domain-containing protein n=1 Tax=Dendrothele bispora (strain CBS 962.96) TaxID=1314807 RepID=A0A4S8KV53_DENBC|nr:hypothetical protein K435DRAFT_697356 [Dendrothele bispora CBS 962.96]
MAELPLKEDVFNEVGEEHAKSAYSFVLEAEKVAIRQEDLVSARVVGYLLLYPFTPISCKTVTTEILSIHRFYSKEVTEKIFVLGKMYIGHLIRPFRKFARRTPVSSQHVSRPSFDSLSDMIKTTLVQYPKSHSEAKSNALIRDGFRCMVTRKLDLEYLAEMKDLRAAVQKEWPNDPLTSTQCAHIFPKSTNSGISGTTPVELQKLECAASLWAILERFGYSDISQELNGQHVHQLGNVLTLDITLHDWMDKLALWFEKAPDGVSSMYKLPEDVTFTVDQIIQRRLNPESLLTELDLPLPNPTYLHIHASVCRVAHMSGAADYIDFISRAMEQLDVLAEDGSSADFLAGALSFFTTSPYVVTGSV